jgi:hypothetical protein
MLEHVILPHFTCFGALSFVVVLALWGLPAVRSADGPKRYWRGAVAGPYCPRELCGAGGMGLDVAPPHRSPSRLCLQACGAQCRSGSVLGPLAFQGPHRPNRYWAVSTLLGLRGQSCWACALGVETRHTGRTTAHAHGDDYPSPEPGASRAFSRLILDRMVPYVSSCKPPTCRCLAELCYDSAPGGACLLPKNTHWATRPEHSTHGT